MEKKNFKNHEFDDHASKYKTLLKDSFPSFLRDIEYYSQYKVKLVHKHRENMSTKSILDYGCGVWLSLRYFSEYFPNSSINGYDESNQSLKYAKDKVPKVNIYNYLEDIPKNYFDVVFISNILHHINENDHLKTIMTCGNFLKPEGYIYLFEHNPLNPITRIIFKKSPLDKHAKMIRLNNIVKLSQLAKMKIVNKQYNLFFPKQLSLLRFIERLIKWIPIGAQYMIVLKK